ncbi:MAG: hypothetical protein LAO21_06210 [Acidobacteriia bacterium]|nr:hypothetical protein [Terriglobia bacterium]
MTDHSTVQDEVPKHRRAAVDLSVVIAFFLVCSAALPVLDPILRRGRGLAGVLALAGYQFACEGLALVFIVIVRHERLSRYGFTWRNADKSVALGLVLALVLDLAMSWQAGALLWIPLRRHSATRMSMADGLSASILGLAATVAVWGLVESFFGVFFSKKLNEALGRSGRGWLSTGALGFAFFNGLIHFVIGQGFQGFMTSFASGYAIAVIPAVTENAWGSAVVQILTNAVGKL